MGIEALQVRQTFEEEVLVCSLRSLSSTLVQNFKILKTDCIARISGKDGVLLGWIYLPELREGLFAAGHTSIDVLNGIAWDQEQDRLFVTGKLWPKLYEIKVHLRMKPFQGDIQSLCMPPADFGKS